MSDRPRVRVVGDGLIASALREEFGEANPAEPVTLTVTADDGWSTVDPPGAGPSLPIWTELDRVAVGPVRVPGEPGCVRCARERRRRARPELPAVAALVAAATEEAATWLTAAAARTVAAVVAGEAARITAGRSPRTRQALLFVDLATLAVATHRFLPDPHCPVCGGLPDDAAAELRLVARPAASRGAYRLRSLVERSAELGETYRDEETGLIRSVARDVRGGVVVAAAEMGLRAGGAEAGYGRGRDYRSSTATAIAEALERFGGLAPGGRRTVVRACYADLGEQAVDPRGLGVHSPDAYRESGFGYLPFDEKRPYRWVWGYSFGRGAPVLVPESYAYYRSRAGYDDEPPLLYEVSNGCALGSCVEEAILHGILEVAERDAFLLTWYARMTPRRLDLTTAADPAIPLLAATIEAETGYQLDLFDITMEQGIPAVWALGAAATGAPGQPQAACTAACHPDQGRAVANALAELGPLLADLDRGYATRTDLARELVEDPTRVTEMDHHALLYADPAAYGRLEFLTRGTETVPLRPSLIASGDLTADLRALVARYQETGLDVIVVDQTTPEHRAGGFACVKVIIPGTVPMTFGHRNRRVHGLPRLRTVPVLLGHPAPGRLNPHPHPFP